jgi:membrane peptidoglycan carboxypeptidase
MARLVVCLLLCGLQESQRGAAPSGFSSASYCDETAARNIGREQVARLAAILPAPLKRRPERMNNCSARILARMGQMGW